jgi:hypothetical protein
MLSFQIHKTLRSGNEIIQISCDAAGLFSVA